MAAINSRKQKTVRPKAGKKNKWGAAALNFVLFGAGYLYVGSKRKSFAYGLIAAEIISSVFSIFEIILPFWVFVWATGLGLAFAYDAYKDAEETE